MDEGQHGDESKEGQPGIDQKGLEPVPKVAIGNHENFNRWTSI
jgi:hypothetical protein